MSSRRASAGLGLFSSTDRGAFTNSAPIAVFESLVFALNCVELVWQGSSGDHLDPRECSYLVQCDRQVAIMAVRFYVAVMFAALLVAGASGQTQDCTQAYNYLTACLSYVSGNDTTPSLPCCSGINYLNTNNADCLCQIVKQFNSSITPGVNATKAYQLPSQCGIVVDTAKCPALALAPGAAIAPTPPFLSPPAGSPGAVLGPSSAPGRSAAVAIRASPLTVTFMALLGATLGATHLLWNVLTAT